MAKFTPDTSSYGFDDLLPHPLLMVSVGSPAFAHFTLLVPLRFVRTDWVNKLIV